jgi:hypothetical protein
MNNVLPNTINLKLTLWVLPEVCLELIYDLHIKSVIKKSNMFIQKTAAKYNAKGANYAAL